MFLLCSLMEKVSMAELAALRLQIARLERHAVQQSSQGALATGAPLIDAAIPDGGLARGALHEVAGRGPEVEHGCAAGLFVAHLLSRVSGQVLWIMSERDLFAPALCEAGLPPDRVLFVEAGKSVLLAMEEGLRVPGLAGVVAEMRGRLTLTASRRLQLASETSGVTGFLLRRSRYFDDPSLSEPTAAVTRWRIACVPSPPALPDAADVAGVGRARWQLDLTRCRGGAVHSWLVEAGDAQNRLDLVSELADGPDPTRFDQRAAG
jgi:protein ImuA